MEQNMITIDRENRAEFHNHTDYCIGTGRMGLALQQEYQEQLAYVQQEIGFSHIRGHGLFCDDMAIYQEYEENGEKKAEYNFTYLDRVMDSYLAKGIRPFLELGFMPERMASGDQTVFYWKGNVTPPVSYEAWCALVQATLTHLCRRYGRDEVVQWPVEVWNEPNLAGFWKDANREEYFQLFARTFWAVKEVDSDFRVGGPAICGVEDEEWIREFLNFCRREQIPVDFITRHHYTTEAPEYVGHYGYAKLHDPGENSKTLKNTRRIVDGFPEFAGKEIHITEFNTSYIPNCPLHDTNRNAAYIARMLSWLGDDNASYSYWTFGDVFEENGVPYTPFHGGFGLMANGCIPKPTFWTFSFFKKLQGSCVYRSEEAVVVKSETGYRAVLWNLCMEDESKEREITLRIPSEEGECYRVIRKIVDEEVCNPLKVWHDLGEPSSLTEGQTALLRECARPLIVSERCESREGEIQVKVPLRRNAVIYLEIEPAGMHSDRGYSYERAVK